MACCFNEGMEKKWGKAGEKAMKSVITIIGIVALVFTIGGSSGALAGNSGPKILKVKGLYLGMNIDEGSKIFKKFITFQFAIKYGEGEPLEVTQIPPFDECHYGFGYFPYGCPIIFLRSDCSKGRKVKYIHIHNDIVDEMFDAKQLSQEAFVQEFENAYDITMKFKERPNTSGDPPSRSWEFVSPIGYKVTIDQGHAITIEKITNKSR